jgi:hypothetical protein
MLRWTPWQKHLIVDVELVDVAALHYKPDVVGRHVDVHAL